jgi:hypothetical protein
MRARMLHGLKMAKNVALLVSTAAVLLVFPGHARASDLSGDNVTVNYLYPDVSTVFQALGTGTVTSGGFTVNSFGQHDLTVYPADITLTNVYGGDVMFLSGSFNGYELIDNTGAPPITGVSIAFNDISGFSSSDISFDATHVWLNLEDLTTTSGQDLQVDLSFGTSSAVPEPATLSLVAVGLLGAGLIRRMLLA